MDELPRLCQKQSAPRAPAARAARATLAAQADRRVPGRTTATCRRASRRRWARAADQQRNAAQDADREQFPILPPPAGERAPDPTPSDLGLGRRRASTSSWRAGPGTSTPSSRCRRRCPTPSLDEAGASTGRSIACRRRRPCRSSAAIRPAARPTSPRTWRRRAGSTRTAGSSRDWFDRAGRRNPSSASAPRSSTTPRPPGTAPTACTRSYGVKTGMYLSPAEMRDPRSTSGDVPQGLRARTTNAPGPERLPAKHRNDPVIEPSWTAPTRSCTGASRTIRLTNYAGHFSEAEAERSPEAVLVQQALLPRRALRRYEGDPERALALYERRGQSGWGCWCVMPALRRAVGQPGGLLRNAAQEPDAGAAAASQPRSRPWSWGWPKLRSGRRRPLEDLLTPGDKSRILPIRNVQGVLDWVRLYDVPNKSGLSRGAAGVEPGGRHSAGGAPRCSCSPGRRSGP